MTSAEFAATYRVLKTLTEQGARSQIAQEVALGRMVMVHALDVGSAIDRQRLRASVGSLQPSAAEQVLGVYDVEGTTTVVTRFLTTFTDLPSWLRDNALPDDAKTQVIAAVPSKPSQPMAPAPVAPVAPKQDASFTAIFAPSAVASADVAPAPARDTPSFSEVFGAAKAPPVATDPVHPPAAAAPPTPSPSASGGKSGESFTQIFGGIGAPSSGAASTPAQSAPASPPAAPPAAPATPTPVVPKGGESFSQVFGVKAAPTPPTDAPPPLPLPGAPRFDAVIPPQLPEAPRAEPAAPPPRKASGEFTQLFDRLTPGMSVPAQPRPQAPPPTAAPAAPTPSWSKPPTPALTPPPPAWQAPPSRPQPAGNAGAPVPAGPSEFTRILGKVSSPEGGGPPRSSGGPLPAAGLQMPQMPQMQMPQVPQMNVPGMQLPQMQLPQAQLPAVGLTPLSVPQQAADAGPSTTRSHLPLIIALNVVLIAAIALVLYLVLKR